MKKSSWFAQAVLPHPPTHQLVGQSGNCKVDSANLERKCYNFTSGIVTNSVCYYVCSNKGLGTFSLALVIYTSIWIANCFTTGHSLVSLFQLCTLFQHQECYFSRDFHQITHLYRYWIPENANICWCSCHSSGTFPEVYCFSPKGAKNIFITNESDECMITEWIMLSVCAFHQPLSGMAWLGQWSFLIVTALGWVDKWGNTIQLEHCCCSFLE